MKDPYNRISLFRAPLHIRIGAAPRYPSAPLQRKLSSTDVQDPCRRISSAPPVSGMVEGDPNAGEGLR